MEPLNLGQLIDALGRHDPKASVGYDFCRLAPAGPWSYRGYYDHLALGFNTTARRPTVDELLIVLRGAVGKVFEGYKGGNYTMTRATPVWVAQWGDTSETRIAAVEKKNDVGDVVLVTMTSDEWL